MAANKVEEIIREALRGNELPFDHFLEDLFKNVRPKLLSLTHSKSETDAIFIASMQKFWERFVIQQKKLPHNIEGYVFTMCKNAWLMTKRDPWNSIVLSNSLLEYSNLLQHKDEFDAGEKEDKMQQEWLKRKAFSMALDELSPKCKTLIESEMNPQIKLKDLQYKLKYTNYQALVQAKYNCKKRLIREVYKILNRLKNS